jgi:surface polysaccharide O-acyltransferase-like enzyme
LHYSQTYLFTAIHGAKAYGIPVARTSRAVAAPIFFMRAGSLVDQRKRFQKFDQTDKNNHLN